MNRKFRESHALNFISRKTGKIWDVVIIEAGFSKNNIYYSENVLREAAPLFEGVKASLYGFGDEHFNHVPNQLFRAIPRLTKNIVGWFEKVHFGPFTRQDGSEGSGLLARFTIFDAEKKLQSKLQESFDNGHANLLGLSIDAEGSKGSPVTIGGRRGISAGKIKSVQEVTVVTDPSAGGGVIRLVASTGDSLMKTFYAQMCSIRPAWLSGFAGQDVDKMEDDKAKDYVVRILESNLQNAQTSLISIPSDEVNRFAAHGRGIKSISEMLGFVKDGDVASATRLIENWSSANNIFELPFETVSAADGNTDADADADVDADADAGKDKAHEAKEKELALRESSLMVKERLAASSLPTASYPRITMLFEGKTGINIIDIDRMIASEVEYIGRLKEGGTVNVSSGHNDADSEIIVGDEQRDKWAKGFDGFFDNNRSQDGVPAFRGLREAFAEVNGGKWASPDQMAEWVFRSIQLAFPQNARTPFETHLKRVSESWEQMAPWMLRESVTTGDFTILFGDAMNRRLQKEYTSDPLNDWRLMVSSIENLNDATNPFHVPRIGGQTILPVVGQGAPYQEGDDPTEEDEILQPSKRGRILKFTWEDMLADRVGVLKRFPRILAKSSNRTVQQLIFNEIELNPNMNDGTPLIDALHNNLVTASPALSGTEFNNAVILLRNQTEQDSGEKLGLAPFRILTGPAQEATAIEIANSRTKVNAGEDATVTNANTKWGVSAHMSIALGASAGTANRWWVMANPMDAETIAVGFLGGRDQPDMFVQGSDSANSGSFFDADEITIKVRLVVGAKVVDHRGFVGSLV